MFTYPFKMVSATATILLIHNDDVLLGRRASKEEKVFAGWLSLPGGFLNAEEETIEHCAIRETFEETALRIEECRLNLFHISSGPKTDPRAHVINACYWVKINDYERSVAKPGDDLSELTFVNYKELIENRIELAFDHITIAKKGIKDYGFFLGKKMS